MRENGLKRILNLKSASKERCWCIKGRAITPQVCQDAMLYRRDKNVRAKKSEFL